jgi:hypothetical protein
VATGNRQAALEALKTCGLEDLPAIQKLKDLKGDWRRAAVAKWIENAEGMRDMADAAGGPDGQAAADPAEDEE